jgi:carboxyl-terminal processing protease
MRACTEVCVKKNRIATMLIAALAVVLFMGGSYILGVAAASETGSPASPGGQLLSLRQQANLIDRALDLMQKEYFMEITPELRKKLVYGALKGMMSELSQPPFNDDFSHFYDPELYKDLNAQTTGKYAGIGVLMGQTSDGAYPQVETVFPKTPAEDAGIQVHDVIAEIDGKDTYDMILPEVAAAIKGEPGTKVKVKMFRPDTGESKEYDIVRRAVEYSSVSKAEVLSDKVGYIEITSFAEDTGDDFRAAMEKLTGQGITSVIIDLRNNTGGLLDAAQAVADCFVKEGPIVEVDYRNQKPVVLPASSDTKKYNIPVVMLVNGSSASASEVLTAALRDYGVATVVGEKTFGKGVVQEVTPMETIVDEVPDGNGGTKKQARATDALALTVGKYYTPKREEIHKVGITPDVYYDLQNQLKDDPKLKELQARIEAKAEEMRKLRAEANAYLRNPDKDAQKLRAADVAKRLSRGEKIEKVAKLEPPKDDHSALLSSATGIVPGDKAKDGKDVAKDADKPATGETGK